MSFFALKPYLPTLAKVFSEPVGLSVFKAPALLAASFGLPFTATQHWAQKVSTAEVIVQKAKPQPAALAAIPVRVLQPQKINSPVVAAPASPPIPTPTLPVNPELAVLQRKEKLAAPVVVKLDWDKDREQMSYRIFFKGKLSCTGASCKNVKANLSAQTDRHASLNADVVLEANGRFNAVLVFEDLPNSPLDWTLSAESSISKAQTNGRCILTRDAEHNIETTVVLPAARPNIAFDSVRR